MMRFETKEAMEIKLALTIAEATHQLTGENLAEAFEVAILSARCMSKYAPQSYRGGWVIPQFGYSVERIGKHISTEEAGDPCLVAE